MSASTSNPSAPWTGCPLAAAKASSRAARYTPGCTCFLDCRCKRAARITRRNRYLAVGAAVTVALVACLAAQADVLVAGPDGSDVYAVQDVIDAGGLRVGNLTFSEFRVVSSAGDGAWAPSAAEIMVSGALADGKLGLSFNASWAAEDGGRADTTLTFKVAADTPRALTDHALWTTAHGTIGDGLVMVTENVYDADPLHQPAQADAVANAAVFYASGDDQQTYDYQEFSLAGQPVALPEVWVVKDIHVLSGGDGSRAALSELRQSFGDVPEPATIAFLALGAAGVLARKRRARITTGA